MSNFIGFRSLKISLNDTCCYNGSLKINCGFFLSRPFMVESFELNNEDVVKSNAEVRKDELASKY